MKFCLKSLIAAFALSSTILFAATFEAQDKTRQVTVVSHVDIKPDAYMPQAEESAAKIFRAQIAATEHDRGLVSYVVLQEQGGANHFTIVETWRDANAYNHHVGADHTVKFRADIEPFLGSPFDSRLHHLFR